MSQSDADSAPGCSKHFNMEAGTTTADASSASSTALLNDKMNDTLEERLIVCDVSEEANLEMTKTIQKTMKKHNLTATNVRSILHVSFW